MPACAPRRSGYAREKALHRHHYRRGLNVETYRFTGGVVGRLRPVVRGDDAELAKLREEITQLRQEYEAPVPAPAPAAPVPLACTAPAFNPDISAVLTGTYANISQDPNQYRIQGFVPGGDEIGPGKRGFSLGESEVTLSANVDPRFAGQLTFALSPDNEVSVEEAFFQTKGLASGINLGGGRFLSSISYQNSQHAHTTPCLPGRPGRPASSPLPP